MIHWPLGRSGFLWGANDSRPQIGKTHLQRGSPVSITPSSFTYFGIELGGNTTLRTFLSESDFNPNCTVLLSILAFGENEDASEGSSLSQFPRLLESHLTLQIFIGVS